VSIETLAFFALSALVVIIFLMVYIRDIEVNKKLLMYEKSIEELNFQNHQLSKNIKELAHHETIDPQEIEKRMLEKVKQEIQNTVIPMVSSLQDIESIMQTFQIEQTARIDRIESRTKEMSCMPTSSFSSNEKMIVSQYAKGKSEAEIAKDLRVGIGEVDLVLKLANLK
jgi:DNA-binding NarL/FixJ family response regulator